MIFKVENLQVGMVVKKDIYDKKGKLLLVKANTSLSVENIEDLLNSKIEEVEIILDEKELDKYNLDLGVKENIDKDLYENILNTIKSQNINNIKNCANTIVEKVNNNIKYNLVKYRDISNDMYDKDIRIAVFASVLATEINKQINDSDFVKNVVSAALLKDIGNVCSDNMEMSRIRDNGVIFDSKLFNSISNDAFDLYNPKYISLYSYNMLSSEDENLRMMVLLSNENVIGTGFLGATKDVMSTQKRYVWGAKIIKLCSVFDDELIAAVRNNTLNKVFDNLRCNNTLDQWLVNIFIELMPLYCEGCKVQLTNGNYAIVIQSSKNKPIVKDLDQLVIIDLNREDSLDVNSVVGDEIKFSEL